MFAERSITHHEDPRVEIDHDAAGDVERPDRGPDDEVGVVERAHKLVVVVGRI